MVALTSASMVNLQDPMNGAGNSVSMYAIVTSKT